MSLGNSQDNPMSPTDTPSLRNGARKTASAEQIRMSAAAAMANAPPTAGPLTAATTGCGMSRMAWVAATACRIPSYTWSMGSFSELPMAEPERSIPALKAPPAPVITTAPQLSSAPSVRRTSVKSRSVPDVSEFIRPGRSKVTIRTPSSRRSTVMPSNSLTWENYHCGSAGSAGLRVG